MTINKARLSCNPNNRAISKRERIKTIFFFLFFIAISLSSACNNTTDTVIANIKLLSPIVNSVFNKDDDALKNKVGFQMTIKVEVENLLEHSKITLTSNGKNPVTQDLKDSQIVFENYTLQEGKNLIQLTLTMSDNTTSSSELYSIFVDTQCYQLNIKPVSLQADITSTTSIKVMITPHPLLGEDVELIVMDSTDKKRSFWATPIDGEALFSDLKLPTGKVKLIAKIQDSAGNRSQTETSIQVK